MREVCGETVLVAEGIEVLDFNRMMCLNEAAAFLWREAVRMGDFTAEGLARSLCAEYEVDEATAAADVADIVGIWQREGLMVKA